MWRTTRDLVVGNVLELPWGADVAEGEDALHRRLLELVDVHQSGRPLDGNPRGFDVETIAVGDSTRGHEHGVGPDAAAGNLHVDAGA